MADQVCTIGKTFVIRGNLSGGEDLTVEGRIEGSLSLSHHLLVESSGVVEASLEVEDLTVNGAVQGEIHASRCVCVNPEAKVVGNISAPRVIIEDGARFKGYIDMDVPLPEGIQK